MEFSGCKPAHSIKADDRTLQKVRGGCKTTLTSHSNQRISRLHSPHPKSVLSKKSDQYLKSFEQKRILNETHRKTPLLGIENRTPLKQNVSRGLNMVRASEEKKKSNLDGIFTVGGTSGGIGIKELKSPVVSALRNSSVFADDMDNALHVTKGTKSYSKVTQSPSVFNSKSNVFNGSSNSSSVTLTPLRSKSSCNLFDVEKQSPDDDANIGCSPHSVAHKKRRLPFAPIASAVKKSSILSDISPSKIEKAYAPGPSSPSEKENVPVSPVVEKPVPSHLLGFPNLGNTCYLNAVLQSLISLRVFRCGVSKCMQTISPHDGTLLHALALVLAARNQGTIMPLKQSLRLFKINFEKLDPSFVGWKMQDANEFLTKVLDTIKDEIEACQAASSGQKQVLASSEAESASSPKKFSALSLLNLSKINCSSGNILGVLNNSVVVSSVSSSEEENARVPKGVKRSHSVDSDGSPSKRIACEADSSVSSTTNSSNDEFSNPITDNFGFQLQEVFKCLNCSSTVKKCQEYFNLYVHLSPASEDDECTPGPASIREAVADYMKTELRDLKCEKCHHPKVEVTSSFAKMPRILIVQVKRYMYSTMHFSSLKVHSSIKVNKYIDLLPFASDESLPYPSLGDEVSKSTPPTPYKVEVSTPKSSRPKSVRFRDLSNEGDSKTDCEVTSSKNPIDVAKKADDNEKNSEANQTNDEATKELTEDEQIQEALRRSLEESSPPHEVTAQEAETELERAIKLSLEELKNKQQEQHFLEAETEQKTYDDPWIINETVAPSSADEMGSLPPNGELLVDNSEGDGGAGPHSYVLGSIVTHFGTNTTAGHYVCDVLSDEAKGWLHYDDDCVTDISPAVVLGDSRQRNGYIFFYVHRDLLNLQDSEPT